MEAHQDMEVIRGRVLEELIGQGANDSRVEELLNTIRPDGSWPGIDYQDTALTGFEHREHYTNMLIMARSFSDPKSAYKDSKPLQSALVNALSFWVDHDFRSENWWYNQIGVPRALLDVLLLMGDDLPTELVESTRPLIGRAHINAWGARQSGDRIKIAGIEAKHNLLVGDTESFEKLIKIIEGEIKFSEGRGMQRDFSFHHRVDRVNNTLSYGLEYANVFAEWASYVAGTQYAFSEQGTQQLIDYYIDGICKQMVYGAKPDMGVQNREVTRSGAHRNHGTQALERLVEVSDYREGELKAIIDIRKGERASNSSHATFYWQSEHFTFQRPTYFASVRMHSRRNQNMEYAYNGEGVLNHHRGDGGSHVYVSGDEYDEIAPVFDYQMVPGATIVQKAELPPETEVKKPGLTDFVGAVTDGNYGAAAFDFISPHDPLSAKKAWFFFEGEYVCLGAGIDTYIESPVVTTLNQCRLDGDVFVMADGNETVLDRNTHELSDVKWIHHGEVAYLFPEPETVHLSNKEETGSWYRVNRQTRSSKEEIRMDVFKLWFDHGVRPEKESYCYMVVPSVEVSEIMDTSDFRRIEVLSNTEELQAVRHDELKIVQAIFYESGSVKVTDALSIECESQGMLMAKFEGDRLLEISVADPSRKLKRIHLRTTSPLESRDGDGYKIKWSETQRTSSIIIELPQDSYSGKSVVVSF
jgi:chondroitin AC lyase